MNLQVKYISILYLLSFIITSPILAQDYKQSIILFQEELNREFSDSASSPLNKEDLKTFDSLKFYPINDKLRIEAKFVKSEQTNTIKMKTSTKRQPVYDIYGQATFTINNKEYTLNLYQSHRLREKEDYKNYLFLPFNDITNGKETYGGGRYIDLEIPNGNTITIDFNKAYHPYCAYNAKYSCPVPPIENFLDFKVEAGIKY